MRYTEIDLQCEDIMWFGVDKTGAIFECTTGGIGNVPEFVCKSKETNELLCKFFIESLSTTTEANLLCDYDEENDLLKDCISLAQKGIYCFDISEDEKYEGDYIKISVPKNPINLESLPERIKELMKDRIVNEDISEVNLLHLKHAY